MTSPKQIEANKRNATLSTGPRSEQGKQVSRMNALSHGLTAKQVVIEGEDPEDFNWLLEGLIEEFAPQTILEQQLIERLAGYLWRGRRTPVLEAAILEVHRRAIQSEHPAKTTNDLGPSPWVALVERYRLQKLPLGHPEESDPPEEDPEPPEPEESPEEAALREQEEAREKATEAVLDLGRAFLRDASQHDALGKLSRYEVHLVNSAERTIQQLDKLRDKRLAEPKSGARIVDLESFEVDD